MNAYTPGPCSCMDLFHCVLVSCVSCSIFSPLIFKIIFSFVLFPTSPPTHFLFRFRWAWKEATSFLECDYEKIDLEIVWVSGLLFCGLQSYPCIDKLLLAITMYISVLGYSSNIQCQLSQGWDTKVQGQSSYLDMNISYGTDTIRMWTEEERRFKMCRTRN